MSLVQFQAAARRDDRAAPALALGLTELAMLMVVLLWTSNVPVSKGTVPAFGALGFASLRCQVLLRRAGSRSAADPRI